jgi:hypothetical protein
MIVVFRTCEIIFPGYFTDLPILFPGFSFNDDNRAGKRCDPTIARGYSERAVTTKQGRARSLETLDDGPPNVHNVAIDARRDYVADPSGSSGRNGRI